MYHFLLLWKIWVSVYIWKFFSAMKEDIVFHQNPHKSFLPGWIPGWQSDFKILVLPIDTHIVLGPGTKPSVIIMGWEISTKYSCHHAWSEKLLEEAEKYRQYMSSRIAICFTRSDSDRASTETFWQVWRQCGKLTTSVIIYCWRQGPHIVTAISWH